MDILGFRIHRISPKERSERISALELTGDRDLEWTYVAARICRYASVDSRILDFGCGVGLLSMAAASLGARVLAVDLLSRQFPRSYKNIKFRQTDVMTLDEKKNTFDLILNCSTIEHVGLSGRYGALEATDGDIEAMQKLRRLLKPGGHMLLTLPVGQDAVFLPLHRIYGSLRLPRLLEGYRVEESTFWHKSVRNFWTQCQREEVVTEAGNDHYYGLGCMVIQVI